MCQLMSLVHIVLLQVAYLTLILSHKIETFNFPSELLQSLILSAKTA